ncbi:MAG: ABC transporter permease [Gammaproteobacteria bacterium]|nr:ABC transporter permease [Gammaproteobacteria bacterium]
MYQLSYFDLFVSAIPAILVILIFLKWQLETKTALYALSRMLLQLLVVGFFLTYIFRSENAFIVLLVLLIMLTVSSWIALRTIAEQRRSLYPQALISTLLGGGVSLLLVTQFSLNISPWYQAQTMIPLAGMIFAGAMNSISIAAERLHSELSRNVAVLEARTMAFRAAMIPMVNSLFAVGLVSLPGMMTGQILSGIDPFVAARYQIMVMFMLFGASGISAASFLILYLRQENKSC